MERFPGGLVFKARRLLYHSTLGPRVIKKGEEKKDARQSRLQIALRTARAPHAFRVQGLGFRVGNFSKIGDHVSGEQRVKLPPLRLETFPSAPREASLGVPLGVPQGNSPPLGPWHFSRIFGHFLKLRPPYMGSPPPYQVTPWRCGIYPRNHPTAQAYLTQFVCQ